MKLYTQDIKNVITTLQHYKDLTFADDIADADIVLSYGGDGTLLKAFSKAVEHGVHDKILLAGINKGTVGFMANDMDDLSFIDAVIHAYATREHIQERQLLDILINDKLVMNRKVLALNEIVIQPRDRGKLFVCNITINIPSMGIYNERIDYSGDGVIISTASGSTAYNLSAGGPILTPNDNSIIISPICPFTMAGRSIILPSDAQVMVESEYPDYVAIDGIPEIGSTNKIIISNSTDTLLLFKQDNFFDTIQTKLGWNRSIK